MTVAFRCSCGQKLRANKNLAGRQTRCPKCSAQVTIPASVDQAPEIDTGMVAANPIVDAAPEIATHDQPPGQTRGQPPATPPATPIPVQPVAPASANAQPPTPAAMPSPTGSSSSGSSIQGSAPAAIPQTIDLMFPCTCGNAFRVPIEFAGKQIPCPHCGTTCSIPLMAPAGQNAPAVPANPVAPAAPIETPAALDPGPIPPAPIPLSGGSVHGDEFKMQRIGLLVAAIATCVVAGSFALWFLGEGLSEISVAMVTSGISKPPERPEFSSSLSREQRQQQMDAYREKYQKWIEEQSKRAEKIQKRAKSAENLAEVSIVFLKIAHIVLFLAIGASIVGYVFCFLNPKRPGIMGVAIAITATAALGAIFQMIFQTVPLLDSKSSMAAEYRGHYPLVFSWPREIDAGDMVLSAFVDLLVFTPWILAGVLLLLIGKTLVNKTASFCGLMAVCLIAGYGLFLVLLFILGMIEIEIESMTPLYVMWVFKWFANLAFCAGLFFLIRGLFAARKSGTPAKPGASGKRSFATNPAFR